MLKVIKYKCFKIRILQPRCQPKHLLAPIAVLNTLSKTAVFIIKNQNTNVKTVIDSL